MILQGPQLIAGSPLGLLLQAVMAMVVVAVEALGWVARPKGSGG